MKKDGGQGLIGPVVVEGDRDRALLALVNMLRKEVNRPQFANCYHFVNLPLDRMEQLLAGTVEAKEVLDALDPA